MITKISLSPISVKHLAASSTPAFGFAKLNETGRRTSDEFGYQNNSFLNENMFKRQSFFQGKTALTTELNNGADFVTLCTDYGCSKNGKANAEFIRTQILSSRSAVSINALSEDTRNQGLRTLFENNYDNPELTKKETDALLELVKPSIGETEYVKYAGLIKVGADR